jgi:two-component system chemotaxis sensor kinase CheA
MSIRMIPMSMVFNRFPRMLRDLASKLGKKVELVTQGEATELDKGLVEKITDPLTHLVRNSCDHGIEMPAERWPRASPSTARSPGGQHQGGSIVIEVRDDGKGLNRDKLLKKARERGIDAPDSMTDQEVYSLIFAPGFSTAEQVTDVSGRGVGMDVVKKNITALGGTVEIDSAEGYGMSVGAPAADAGHHGRHERGRGRRVLHPAAGLGGRELPGQPDTSRPSAAPAAWSRCARSTCR